MKEHLGQSLVRSHERTHEQVRMAANELGGRVHGDVCPKLQGPLQDGGGEGCVYGHDCAGFVAGCDQGWQVCHTEEGVARRLDPVPM